MKTEITKNMLSEYFYPTRDFERPNDNKHVDYAEIEINPNGIEKLEQNLDRYTDIELWVTDSEILDPTNDAYEHIICYVHFDTGTENFNKLYIEVHTAYNSDPLIVENLINEEEKQNIIEAAIESIRKANETNNWC